MKLNFLTLAAAGIIALGGFAVAQSETGHDRGARGHGHGFALERLTEGLDLTPDQQAKVQPIIDRAKPQIAAIQREARQKMKTVMDSTMSQIRPMLTPEQQKKFDDMQNSRRTGRG